MIFPNLEVCTTLSLSLLAKPGLLTLLLNVAELDVFAEEAWSCVADRGSLLFLHGTPQPSSHHCMLYRAAIVI